MYTPDIKNPSLIYSLWLEVINMKNGLLKLWLGRVLTIIDASIQDVEQRKAMKDLVKNAFYSEEAWTKTTGVYFSEFIDDEKTEISQTEEEAKFWNGIKEIKIPQDYPR